MSKAPTEPQARHQSAAGVGLLLPASWWTIGLTDEHGRRASIAHLVDQQIGRGDERAALRADTRKHLQASADDAAAAGGRLMAISLMQAGGVPVPATMTLYRLPGADLTGQGVAQLEAVMRPGTEGSDSLDLADGPLGPVLRRVRRRPGPKDLGAERLTMLTVDYWLDPEDGQGLVYLVFSSPIGQVEEPLLALFDAIMGSIGPSEDA